MELTINNITVFLEACSILFGQRQVYIQWKLMLMESPGVYRIDPDNPNSVAGLIADSNTYDAFVSLSEAERQTAYLTFLKTIYPNN
ncbi:MAG: hypothetical protein JWQ57_2246 [Mucilaginibacter sp.]|nr:hypothetical protein [Mucilaginibacter sp.]